MLQVPLSFVLALIGIIVATYALFLSLRTREKVHKNREEIYNFEKSMAELSEDRDYYEDKIIELNERLLSSSDRFKDVNHLLMGSWEKSPKELSPRVQNIPKFLEDAGIERSDLKVENDLVFVLTPFNDDMSSTYKTISRVCENNKLRCKRGDENFIQGDIFPHILKHIVKARLVVANINGRNPNVFYELGITHTLDKPTLIVAENLTDAPFDVRSKRMILYDNEKELQDKLNENIKKVLAKL